MKFRSSDDYWDTVYKKIKVLPDKQDVVLDLGCGDGDVAVRLAKHSKQVIGIAIDGSFDNLSLPANVELRKMDAEKLSFPDNHFDLVFAKDTLHHIKNVGLVLNEVRRVLKPQGRLIIVEANRYNPIFYINTTKIAKHNHFSTGYLKLLVEENGFSEYRHFFIHSRDYRINNLQLHVLLHIYESLVEKLPLFKHFSTYNVIHAVNQK